MSAVPKHEMDADAFLAWVVRQPKEAGRFELIDGHVVMQQSERLVHVEVKATLQRGLRDGLDRAKAACFSIGDGATVRVSKTKVYKPDALVYCGPRLPAEGSGSWTHPSVA